MSTAANLVGSIPKTGNAFIDSVSDDAILSQRETGVPASVTLAQAILESGWGKSSLSKKYNNYFGIKGKGSKGTIVLSTGEHLNGKDVVIQDGFRVYATAAESFADHGRFFIVNKRYAEAMRHTDDAERFAKEIHKAGYATDPGYSGKLISLIRQYKLTAFDKIARQQGGLAGVGTAAGAGAAALGSVGAHPTATAKPTPTTSSKPTPSPIVKELQLLLVKYGYMTTQQMQTGPGILGSKTQAAVTRLLEDQGKGASVQTGTGGSGHEELPTPGKVVALPTPTTPATSSAPMLTLDYKQISQNFKVKIPGSKYFTWHEALWLPSAHRYASGAEVNGTILQNIVKQATALDRVREHFQKSIVVHCWLRPPVYNKSIGGAPNSAHLRGTATDFHIEGYTAAQVRKVLLADKSIYPGAGELDVTWMHLDLEHKAWFKP